MRYPLNRVWSAGLLCSILGATALTAVQTPAPTAPQPTAKITNVWPNPSAEAGVTGATGDSPDAKDVTVSQQKSDAWRGKASFELRFTAGPGGMAALVFGADKQAVVNAKPGQTCFFRVAAKLAAGSTDTALEMRAHWLDDTGRLVGETPAVCCVKPSARRPWMVLDGWDTAPAGATRVALALYTLKAAGATVLRADGVQITPDPARFVSYVDGNEPGCSWDGAPNASASSTSAAKVNLVSNPSFERGIQDWRSDSGDGGSVRSLERNRSWGSAGRNSLRLVGSVAKQRNSYISILSQPIPVLGGEEYTLRATVKVAKLPAGGRVSLVLGWLDSNGAYLFAESMTDPAVVTAPGVRQLQITKPAPRDAVSALAVVGTAGGAAGEYDLSADGFSLIADSGAMPTRPFWVGFNDQLLNSGPITLEQDVAHSAQLGINCVRLPINLFTKDLYKQVWPSPDAPINLDPVAPTIDAFFKAGVHLMLLCPLTPWMMKDGHLDPAHYPSVGKLSAAFVRRWPQIVAVEPGNEPNSANFWPPAANPEAFVRYLQAVYSAIKAVDPKMPVLAPTCNAPVTKNKSMSMADYMRAFYKVGGGRYCDAISIHPYPFGASSGAGTGPSLEYWAAWADECMYQLREIRAEFHDTKPIWITELGSPSTTPVHPLELIVKPVTEEQQARSTALLYDWARRQGDVYAIIYHTNSEKQNSHEGDFGIFTPEGRLKPAFLALQGELHRTAPTYFDGDTRGCRWTGAPGGSASIRPSSGEGG